MGTSPKTRPGPASWPTLVVRLATFTLPRGTVRDRFRHELLADLAVVDHPRRFAVQVLLRAPSLRRATTGLAAPSPLDDVMTAAKPFLCRTNLHHRWELAETSDGEEFVRCATCLKERDGRPGDRAVLGNLYG